MYQNKFKSDRNRICPRKDNWLLIWCDFEEKNTYVYFKGEKYDVGKLVTSTNLIFKYLEEKEITI